jgi:hypothetical protein
VSINLRLKVKKARFCVLSAFIEAGTASTAKLL